MIIDPKDPFSFVYAPSDATSILGITLQAVPPKQECEIITAGECKVYVETNIGKGDIVRSRKSTDRISVGSTTKAFAGDSPYLQIGFALELGRGLIRTHLLFSYLISGEDTITRVVTGSTSELPSDGLIVFNSATPVTYTLLPAIASGRILQIANIGLGTVTVTLSGSDTINGESTQPVYQYNTMDIKDYTSGKFVII